MYRTLSIEATVYADSDDKYSSIFKNLKDKNAGIIIIIIILIIIIIIIIST